MCDHCALCGRVAPEALCDADLQRLILAIAQRCDRQAFAVLFRKTAPALLAYFRNRGGATVAEECVQETLAHVWHSAGTFDPAAEDASAWLFAVARDIWLRRAEAYIVLRDARLRARGVRVRSLPPSPARKILLAERAAVIARAIDELRPDMAAIVRDVFYRGMSHAEVAKARGIPLGTVKTTLRHALDHLRATLGKRPDLEGEI